ncbi:hypothetical protein FOA52_015605 [Chlamydomonas sp. UWO 241]|nr:hypothetical protein FOA52_015605 [Chlamydomonas sp. UWO 241]
MAKILEIADAKKKECKKNDQNEPRPRDSRSNRNVAPKVGAYTRRELMLRVAHARALH